MRKDSRPDTASTQGPLGKASGGASRAGLIGTMAALMASAALVRYKRARVEHQYPPAGRFIEVDGVKLHYIEQGTGPVLVLLHGAGSLANDFLRCGLPDIAARTHRVIIFDRPGFGYSERPRDRVWGPVTQAELLHAALRQLGVEQATVVGHSWGALVALAMAVEEPKFVKGLVLMGGYYYPTVRPDALFNLPTALPVVGDLLRHTLSPLAMRLAWPGMLKLLFGPAEVPQSFRAMQPWLVLRPLHIRSTSEETALINRAAASLRSRYREVKTPVVIMTGVGDRILSPARHSGRLHAEIEHSEYVELEGVGHMLHYADPEPIIAAIDRVSQA